MKAHHPVLRVGLLSTALLVFGPVQAQQVQTLNPVGQTPELLQPDLTPAGTNAAHPTGPDQPTTATALPGRAAAPMLGEVDLGQSFEPGGQGEEPAARLGTARRAALAAQQATDKPRTPTGAGAAKVDAQRPADVPGIERAVFDRHPVRVALPVQRERLLTLPGPAALHVPHDLDAVARVEAIDRTVYITALVPFAPIRIVAELIEGGQQIPLDLVAGPQAAQASGELQVFLASRASASAHGDIAPHAGASDSAPPAADMVELTRFAARMLYAPRRLATPVAGIQQVQVGQQPVPGLLRVARVLAVPMGQWRSAGLYVTAVRLTNQSPMPLELQLEQLRGNWLAATAQHGRLGVAGSDTDTTAVYLICDRAFESCL